MKKFKLLFYVLSSTFMVSIPFIVLFNLNKNIDDKNANSKTMNYGIVITARQLQGGFRESAKCEIETDLAVITLEGECNVWKGEVLNIKKHYYTFTRYYLKMEEI